MVPSRTLLRVAYWVGAAMDAAMLFPMLSPGIGAAMFGLENFHPGPDYTYAMGLGSALMAGWTVLLIWADRKPLERRGVILITVIPVIAGIAAAGVYAVASGFIPIGQMAPMFVTQTLLAALYLAAYLHSDPRHAGG